MIQRWGQLIGHVQDQQKFIQEKFWRYRNGDITYTESRDEIKNDPDQSHELAIRARRVPRVGYPTFGRQLTDAKRILKEPEAAGNRRFYVPPFRNRPAFHLNPIQRGIATTEFHDIVDADVITARRDFTFIKIVGAGGNGIVGLWRWTPGGNADQAAGYDVAMKYSIQTDDDGSVNWYGIDKEKAIMQNFVRAPHITQIFFLRDKIPDRVARGLRRRPTRLETIQTANNLDSAPGVLFMEFAKMGDLRNWIERLARRGNNLPPEALWRIFDCLVKACNAMEYPPHLRTPGPRNGPPLLEDIPVPPGPPGAQPAAQTGYTGFVHFDLDPKNIFVIGYDQRGATNPLNPDHTQLPRFQIGDFGLAETDSFLWHPTWPPGVLGPRIWERRSRVWDQRNLAKERWFLPEQFSAEWDQLARGPDERPPNAPPGTWPPWDRWRFPSGPGRYSSYSNIWHIGMNMFCLLLLQHPDFPPVAGRMFSAEPPQYDPVPARHQRWTYGYRLIQDSQEGQEYRDRFMPLLCETIARCLMHKQENRPDLVQLQRIITGALGNPPPRLPNTVRRFFGSDAPPPVPWYANSVDVDLGTMDPFTPYHGFRCLDDGPADPADPSSRRRVRGRIMPGDRAYRP